MSDEAMAEHHRDRMFRRLFKRAARNWRTTLASAVTSAAAFVVMFPDDIDVGVVKVAKFIMAGGLAWLGIVAKDGAVTGIPTPDDAGADDEPSIVDGPVYVLLEDEGQPQSVVWTKRAHTWHWMSSYDGHRTACGRVVVGSPYVAQVLPTDVPHCQQCVARAVEHGMASARRV